MSFSFLAWCSKNNDDALLWNGYEWWDEISLTEWLKDSYDNNNQDKKSNDNNKPSNNWVYRDGGNTYYSPVLDNDKLSDEDRQTIIEMQRAFREMQ